jgi:hypothetical protein
VRLLEVSDDSFFLPSFEANHSLTATQDSLSKIKIITTNQSIASPQTPNWTPEQMPYAKGRTGVPRHEGYLLGQKSLEIF